MNATESTAAVDHRLVELHEAVEHMGAGLVDIEDHVVRVLLPEAPPIGVTAVVWAETEARLAAAWQLYPIARDAVARLAAERGPGSTLSPAALARLQSALAAPSVAIDADLCADVRRSAGDITALESFGSPRSLDQLRADLGLLFAAIVAVVGEVEEVWNRVLPALTSLDEDLRRVEERVGSEGDRVPNELAVTRRHIEDLRARARENPLDLDLGFLPTVEAEVRRCQEAVVGTGQRAARCDEQLVVATDRLDEIAVAVAEARGRQSTAIVKFRLGSSLPSLDAEIEELDQLLSELEVLRSDASHDPTPTSRRLDRLLQTSDRLAARVRAKGAEADELFRVRDELRGRLDGFKAKSDATGRSEELDLDAHYRAACAVLYQAPCDLDEAHRVVLAYQAAVNRPRFPEDRTSIPEDRPSFPEDR